MGIEPIFDSRNWAAVPFHFWSLLFFVLGCMWGSFLNVCIYRMPLGQSVVTPPSHCPHCNHSIPWYLNIPLVTWLYLRGKCKNCGAPISVRYFLVELLTGITFLGCWLMFGDRSALLALIYCLLLAGLIVATFIDFEHFIIPDEITIGGIVVGILCSFAVPMLHGAQSPAASMKESFLGALVGGGLIYGILRGGKILFGKLNLDLDPCSRVVFTETALLVPPKRLLWEQLLQRTSGCFAFHAEKVELADRCLRDIVVGISHEKVFLGDDTLDRAATPHLEAVVDRYLSPHETARLAGVRVTPLQLFADWIRSLFDLLRGRRKTHLPPGAHLVFDSADAWFCPDQIPFEDLFYRKSDAIRCEARLVKTQFDVWSDVTLRLSPAELKIGESSYNPETVPHMEVVTDKMTLPREAMGLGDVKFMAAIGAFLGWQAVVFSLMASSLLGAVVGVTLIALKRGALGSRLPYGPYIAVAAALWIFLPAYLQEAWIWNLRMAGYLLFRIPLPESSPHGM
ncbi:MAG: prepilin peptidase [Verrucomicrobia bacterium]|nr:prepilin peptidase [Verrucomicrobiota bacterium]